MSKTSISQTKCCTPLAFCSFPCLLLASNPRGDWGWMRESSDPRGDWWVNAKCCKLTIRAAYYFLTILHTNDDKPKVSCTASSEEQAEHLIIPNHELSSCCLMADPQFYTSITVWCNVHCPSYIQRPSSRVRMTMVMTVYIINHQDICLSTSSLWFVNWCVTWNDNNRRRWVLLDCQANTFK